MPGVQPFFFTGAFFPAIWVSCGVYGIYIVAYSESVKAASRLHPQGWVATQLNW